MDLFQNDSLESFPFSFNSGEELTSAFVDEENPENPLLDCDPEASNDNQDQEDETEDRINGDDEAVNEENYENSKNLETENNDNDDIDNNDSTSTITADDEQVVDHNAAYCQYIKNLAKTGNCFGKFNKTGRGGKFRKNLKKLFK